MGSVCQPQTGQQVTTAAILIIGNEVLSGKVTDTNSPFLLKELYQLGVTVQRVYTIPDNLEVIAQFVKEASESFDFVLTSGGVGPTHDDMTLAGIARAFGLPMKEDPELRASIEHYFKGRATSATFRMASVPEGTRLIYSGELRFPLCVVKNVYVFPGVPQILEAKFQSVKEVFRGAPFYLVKIFTREGESILASRLEATLERHPGVDIGSYPRFDTSEYRVMLTLESKDLALLTQARDFLLQNMDQDQLVRVVDP